MKTSFVAGDTGSSYLAICRDDETGAPISLLDKTALLIWVNPTGLTFTRPLVIVDAAAGRAEYNFQAEELEPGWITFHVRIFDAAGDFITSLKPVSRFVESSPG